MPPANLLGYLHIVAYVRFVEALLMRIHALQSMNDWWPQSDSQRCQANVERISRPRLSLVTMLRE